MGPVKDFELLAKDGRKWWDVIMFENKKFI
jgi:hypothetical protein